MCQGAILSCCPPRALVPASVQVCGEGRGSTCRELFLPFTICYVTKMAFQPQGRWILVHSGCPTVNHCVGAMQAAVWSMLVASSNSTGREWTAGLFPSDVLAGMPRATHRGMCHGCPRACCLLLALAAPSLLRCSAKQQPEAPQSAS